MIITEVHRIIIDTPARIDAPPPMLGQHQKEILGSLGYIKEDIKAMKDKLAI